MHESLESMADTDYSILTEVCQQTCLCKPVRGPWRLGERAGLFQQESFQNTEDPSVSMPVLPKHAAGRVAFDWADHRWKALVILESDTSVNIALAALAMFVLWSVAQTCLTPCDPWTGALQAPLSMGFSRQEHWSGSPCPPPGVLPNPEVEPRSPALQILDQLSPQGSSLPRFKTPQKTKGKYSHITLRQWQFFLKTLWVKF